MERDVLASLKNSVIEAFVQHELGLPLKWSDKVYDEQLARIKAEDPEFNIYDFQPNFENADYVPHRKGINEIEKEYIHNIEDHWNHEEGVHKLPKWDGSGLVLYYTRGEFVRAVSMRDKEAGVDQTEKFRSFVPDRISPDISFIRCEELVDRRLDDNARGKANGLMTSQYLQEEIEEKCTLMAFAAHNLSGKKIPYEDWAHYMGRKEIIRENGIPKFYVSPCVEDLTLLDRGFAGLKDKFVDFQFAVDGIVWYEYDSAYKYDYINSALTKVKELIWSETEREMLFATVSVEPVELEGTVVRNPSSNGTPNLIRMGIAPGCTVEVVRSGVTIPKIINVIDPAPFEYPKCPHCGYQMTEDDIYSAGLKCGNRECIGKYNIRKTWSEGWDAKDYFINNIEEGFFGYLNVSRFNHEAKRIGNKSVIDNELLQLIINDPDKVEEYIGNNYQFTELQWNEAYLNIPMTVKVIREIITSED